MNIQFKPLNVNDENQVRFFVKWNNDPEIKAFISPNRTKEEKAPLTLEKAKEAFLKEKEGVHLTFFIYVNDALIGDYSLQMNPGHLLRNEVSTAWLGLTIGEKEYWGSGVAKIAMLHFIEEAKKLSAKRIELGVFEFNHRAISFYKKLGFQEIGRIPEFTYWNNKLWDDIRMELIL
ncbi:MAG: GNAT family N-acetyltransferase [Oligoflexia bacterium]|nr:GNAT family N-acetyltransferase [Oligoflexia bacterium]